MFPIVQVMVNSPPSARGKRGGAPRASRGRLAAVTSSTVGQQCGNCYGEGQVSTDAGPVTCPDCGGAGVLPSSDVLVEWRAVEIERLHGTGPEQIAQDVRWLIFELRRARSALTKVLALATELGDEPPVQQLRFIANEAIGLYPVAADTDAPAASAVGKSPAGKSPPR